MPKCYWITGLSATGKTTLSTLLVEYFRSRGRQVIQLDGDELRKVLVNNAYTRKERIALGMRYSKLCKLLLLNSRDTDIVISVIGLFKELHKWNRENISNYVEIFIDTPLEELKKRDPKGLYARYKSGKIKNVSGIHLKVDFPVNPDIHIKWESNKTIDSMFQEIVENIKHLRNKQ